MGSDSNEYFKRSFEMCITGLDLAELLICMMYLCWLVLILFLTSVDISLLHVSVHVYAHLTIPNLNLCPLPLFLLPEILIFDRPFPLIYQHVLTSSLSPIHFLLVSSLYPACHLQVQLFYPVEPLASQRALGGVFGSIRHLFWFGLCKLMPSLTTNLF